MPEIKMFVMLGELGGENEYGVVEALQKKKAQHASAPPTVSNRR